MTSKFLSDAKTHFHFPSLLLGFLDDYLDPVKPLNPEETRFLPGGCAVGLGRDHTSMYVSHASFLREGAGLVGIPVPPGPGSDSGQHHFPEPWCPPWPGEGTPRQCPLQKSHHGGQMRELVCVTWVPVSAWDMGQPLLCQRHHRLSRRPDPVLCVLRSVRTPPPCPVPGELRTACGMTASWPTEFTNAIVGKHSPPPREAVSSRE